MIPWQRLPHEAQRALLALILLSYGRAATGCMPPVVCDPAPPPSMVPQPTSATSPVTPMICDPAPPPATWTPTATVTPTLTPTVTPMICDPPPPPAVRTPTVTPMICDPAPAPQSQLPLGDLPASASAEVSAAARPAGVRRLPLAELRWVRIRPPAAGLAGGFVADSPWPGAAYRWSVSGGLLSAAPGGVTWQAPARPGRYLLQVVADWGTDGLAVDALVLVVGPDGAAAVAGV
jgi:hypothetical protein